MIPPLIYLIVFQYVPIYGVIMAFQDFSFRRGYFGSDWVGLEHFRWLVSNPAFRDAFWNTVVINFMRIVFGFPAPIILALLINEVRHTVFKRSVQTLSYLPYFIFLGGFCRVSLSTSWHAITARSTTFCPCSACPASIFCKTRMSFAGRLFLPISGRPWGWGSIIYLATIASIDPTLYEAAEVDGATRLQRILHITLPSLASTMAILFLLSVGNILIVGFDQVFNLYNPLVYETGDIIQTYIVRSLSISPNFSRLTAAGLIQTVIGLALLVIANRAVRALGKEGLY